MNGAEAKEVGMLERLDGMVRNARGAVTVVMASMALGGSLYGLEALGADMAQAATTDAHTSKTHKPKQVQEFLTVQASNPGGDAIGPQLHTFDFQEKCKFNGRAVVRNAVFKKINQPLGKCDVGEPVTITEKQPLQGDWVHRSGVKKYHARATGKNNHFLFVEQEVEYNTPPLRPEPTPTPIPPPPPPRPETDPYASGNIGTDISWAQCGTANETPSGFQFGIVDVNDGTGYSTNPCLESEAANFPGKQLNLYVNTGWYNASSHINPNSPLVCATGDENCLAYNYGYNAGLYAVNAATNAGVDVARKWWLDVETINTWNSDAMQNRQSLQGEYDAIIGSGATGVGAYSTTVQWNDITGNWINNWDSWGATTWTTAADAKTYCMGHEFTGGPSKMMQYTPTSSLDYDVAC